MVLRLIRHVRDVLRAGKEAAAPMHEASPEVAEQDEKREQAVEAAGQLERALRDYRLSVQHWSSR